MPPETLDSFDRKILHALQDHGRMSNADLSEHIALSPSPCLRRVKQLEKRGVITGYRAVIDGAKIGWAIVGFVTINIEQHGPDSVEEFNDAVRRTPQVLTCHALAGANDYLLQVVARDLDDYYELMTRLGSLPGVRDIQSSIGIQAVKQHSGLPV